MEIKKRLRGEEVGIVILRGDEFGMDSRRGRERTGYMRTTLMVDMTGRPTNFNGFDYV
jgi:hypothetical protein